MIKITQFYKAKFRFGNCSFIRNDFNHLSLVLQKSYFSKFYYRYLVRWTSKNLNKLTDEKS